MASNLALVRTQQKYLKNKNLPATVIPDESSILNQPNEVINPQANVFERVGETTLDILGHTVGGISKGIEGIVDYAMGGVGLIGGIFDKEFQKGVEEIIKYDFTQENLLNPLGELTRDSYINDASVKAQKTIRGIASGVGQIIPAVTVAYATGGASLPSTLTFGLGAAGSGVEEALNENANLGQSMTYGTLVGAVETGIEQLGGAIGNQFLGKGVTDNIINATIRKKISSTLGRNIVKTGINAIGEGAEEVLSELFDPFLKLTYKPRNEIEMASLDEIIDSFIIGAGTSLVYGGTLGRIGATQRNIASNVSEYQYTQEKLYTEPLITQEQQQALEESLEDINFDISYNLKKLNPNTRLEVVNRLNESGMNWFNEDGSIDYDRYSAYKDYLLVNQIQPYANFNVHEVNNDIQNKILETVRLYESFKKINKNMPDMVFDNLDTNIDGYYNPKENTLYININGKSPFREVLKHELTHGLKGTEYYQKLLDYSLSALKNSNEYDSLRKQVENQYANELDNLDTQERENYINEELLSIYSERLFSNQNAINTLVNKNRPLAQRIYSWIKAKINRLTGKLSPEDVKLRNELTNVEKLYTKALQKQKVVQDETRYKVYANRGYRGYSMSNRAFLAYEQGEKPISKYTKNDVIELNEFLKEKNILDFDINNLSVKDFKEWLKSSGSSSWHHTSLYANETNFYSPYYSLFEETDVEVLKLKDRNDLIMALNLYNLETLTELIGKKEEFIRLKEEQNKLWDEKRKNKKYKLNSKGEELSNIIKSFDIINKNKYNEIEELKITIRKNIKPIADRIRNGEIIPIDEIINLPEVVKATEIMNAMPFTMEKVNGELIDHVNTPERRKLRNEIAQKLINQGSYVSKGNFTGEVKQDRIAHIVIGVAAAGKSSVFVEPLSKQFKSRIIDSDMAKEMLPEFNDGWGANAVHEESSYIVDELVTPKLLERGDNVVFALVGKNPIKIRNLIKKLKNKYNYQVSLNFNELPIEKAINRAFTRWEETGRFVNFDYISSLVGDFDPKNTYNILKKEGIADAYTWKSNDVARGSKPRTIENSGRERLFQSEEYNNVNGSGIQTNLSPMAERTSKYTRTNSNNDGSRRLKYNSKGEELSKSQQEFFKDSVVRDGQGRLLVVYHGTSQDFTTFNIAKSRSYSGIVDYDLPGFYFTSDKNIASDYGENVKEYYLNITNPYKGDIYKLKQEQGTWRKVYDYLLDNNYDGFIEEEDGIIEYIAFEPNQIKSIDNLSPTDSDDVRFKKSSNIPPNQMNIDDFENFDPNYNPIAKTQKEIIKTQPSESKKKTPPKSETKTIDTKESRFQAKSVPEWAIDNMLDKETVEKVKEMKSYYVPETDKKSLEYINRELVDLDKNYETYVENYIANIENNNIKSKKDIALGIALVQESVKRKDWDNYFRLSSNLTILGTELGQQVQAFSLLNKLTSDGKLYTLKQYLKRENAKRSQDKQINISQELETEFMEAKTETEKQKVYDKIIENVANQMPATTWEKLIQWRYLSMLANPKTHIRNFVGNTVMRSLNRIKNRIATWIESKAIKMGKMDVKDKVHVNPKLIQKATKEFAKLDADEVLNRLSSGSKFAEAKTTKNAIQQERQIFKNKTLESIRKFNFNMLEKADILALKKVYQESLAEWITAKGLTAVQIKENQTLLEQAREYAIKQAQRVTFREFSYLANVINNIKAQNKLAEIAVGGIVPFTKTPINILKTGINYSPLGFVNTFFIQRKKLFNNEININDFVNSLSENLTGSMVFALGMILARLGLVLSGGDEDKEGKYRKELGEQPYSITIGNKSYTLDWIAPASIPLFMGVKLQESLENEGITEIDGLIGAIASASDPLTELSMLSSLNNTLRTYQSNRVQGMVTQTIKNFIAQHIPTLSSQIAKTIDPYRRTTAVTGKENKQARQYINYLKSKIPFLNNTLPPYINVWGNEEKDPNILNRALENMVYPFWIAENNINTPVDNEIMSLFAQTDNKDIIPYIPNSYYTVNGERYDMTPDEYTQYKIDFGKFNYSQLESLFSSTYYQSLSLEQKEEAITKVYSYARDYARKGKYYELYQLLGNNSKNLSTYLLTINSFTADLDDEGNPIPNSKKLKIFKYINSLPLSKQAKNKLFEFAGYSTKSLLQEQSTKRIIRPKE